MLSDLWAPDFMHVLMELNVQDTMYEKEMVEHIQKTRGEIMSKMYGYNKEESYGRSNDDFMGGAHSEEPLPYIPPTEQTGDGYVGLDPPMG